MATGSKQKKIRSMKAARRTTNAIIYVILIAISIIWLFPFVYLVLQSLRLNAGQTHLLPDVWTFDNYINLFRGRMYHFASKAYVNSPFFFFDWYWKTLVIAIAVTVIQTVIVVATSYALSRMRFKMRKPLMNLMLILGMFPGFMSMTAIYFLLQLVGLTQDLGMVGLILVYTASSGMGYYICKGFFDTIPKSLDEAARIDGANRQTIFFKVILPLSKPIIIYTVLTAFMGPWGEYMFASLIAMGKTQYWNVAVGMKNMLTREYLGGYRDTFQQFCAGGVVVSLPITILFFILQRYYVEGVTGGAVKG